MVLIGLMPTWPTPSMDVPRQHPLNGLSRRLRTAILISRPPVAAKSRA
jgi:hypothetical protein